MSTVTEIGTGGMAAWQMPLIHRIFRHAFREIRRLVPDVAPTAPARVAAVADHLRFTLDGLHHHHTTEDELVWPKLRERLGEADAALVERMDAQHHAIDDEVARVRAASDAWAADPGPGTAAPLTDAIDGLLAVMEAHLDEEERVVVPLIDAHVSAAEWEELGRTAFEKFQPRERPIAMGQMLEVAQDDEGQRMLADLPAAIRVLWAVAGRRQYRRYIGAVRGKPVNPVLMRLFRSANPLAVRLYRRSGGKRGGTAKGLPVLLVTVRGRRSGLERTTPVAYFEVDGAYLVSGSGGGMAPEPQWFRNLRRADRAMVEVGRDVRPVAARVLDRPERDRVWADVVLPRAPFFAKYEERSGRVIPLALLTPVEP
jgi:deazaflavin-dependent oxidoreductase (nitroreductase family)